MIRVHVIVIEASHHFDLKQFLPTEAQYYAF